jgi:hypothetical protein
MTAQVGPPEVGESEQECANGGRGETNRRNQHRLQIGGQRVCKKEENVYELQQIFFTSIGAIK